MSGVPPVQQPVEVAALYRYGGRTGDHRGIDVFTETLLRLSQAARRLPNVRGGKHPHPFTLSRWATVGRKSKLGVTVKLETCRIGGTVCTSLQALERFFARLDDAEAREPVVPAKQSALQRQASKEVEELRRRGLVR